MLHCSSSPLFLRVGGHIFAFPAEAVTSLLDRKSTETFFILLKKKIKGPNLLDFFFLKKKEEFSSGENMAMHVIAPTASRCSGVAQVCDPPLFCLYFRKHIFWSSSYFHIKILYNSRCRWWDLNLDSTAAIECYKSRQCTCKCAK